MYITNTYTANEEIQATIPQGQTTVEVLFTPNEYSVTPRVFIKNCKEVRVDTTTLTKDGCTLYAKDDAGYANICLLIVKV